MLGPGRRTVLWFQGCALDCPGCIAFEMNRSSDHRLYRAEQLADRVISGGGQVEGITLSGGDPFDQPLDELHRFLKCVRESSSLSVMCYTGRTLSELNRHPQQNIVQQILSHTDILIDGRYVEDRNDGALWRGSSNQTVHFLSERYQYLAADFETVNQREVEIELTADDQLLIAGIPRPGFMNTLSQRLSERGFDLGLSTAATNQQCPVTKEAN
ncbi:MAG: 4Fe-4S single cluster domain-containing protein [Planctomycetaceae bacterium]